VTRVNDGAVRRATTRVRVRAIDGDTVKEQPDTLVTEEPMEIRVHGPGQEPRPLAVTMRTPGHDFELAVGFCRTEGVFADPGELDTVAYCLAGTGEQEFNVVTVRFRRPVQLDAPARQFVANASCGLCGKTTLDEVEQHCEPVADGPVVTRSVVASLPESLLRSQRVFEATGGLHASALFTSRGELIALREDVGRHNALDKLVGHAVLALLAQPERKVAPECVRRGHDGRPSARPGPIRASASNAARISPSARWSRDFAVPTGIPRAAATAGNGRSR